MPFDFKKEYKEFYLPPRQPQLVTVPPMRFAAVRGEGDPNQEGGAYQQALSLLYGIAFTVKMSPRAGHAMDGFFEYVVPPLEGLWWMRGADGTCLPGIDYARKADFRWISMIRLPDFVTREEFEWAQQEAARKKGSDFSAVDFFCYDEGLCVQCMHIGPYDAEPATVAAMDDFAVAQGCRADFSPARMHHEIYLSDARRCAKDKLKTVIRHPVARLR